jgi:hypothetical protein
MLEETGLAYEPHLIDISNNESKDPAFVSLNPTDAYRRSSIRLALTVDPSPYGNPVRSSSIWPTRRVSSSPPNQASVTRP